MLPAGKYKGQIQTAVLGESSGGNAQMVITWSVYAYFDGQDWTEVAPPEERRTYWSFSDKAAKYSFDKLNVLGFNQNFEEPQFTVGEAELACWHEEYEGKETEKWDLANFGGEVKAAAPDKVRRVQALYRNYQSSNPSAAPPKPAIQPASNGHVKSTRRPAAPTAAAPAAAKPAPRPAASSAPAGVATAEPATRDSAWAALVAMWGEKYDDAGLAAQWEKIIQEVTDSTGATEAEFGPEEWKQVADNAEIPF